jgi:hypothetical protein
MYSALHTSTRHLSFDNRCALAPCSAHFAQK